MDISPTVLSEIVKAARKRGWEAEVTTMHYVPAAEVRYLGARLTVIAERDRLHAMPSRPANRPWRHEFSFLKPDESVIVQPYWYTEKDIQQGLNSFGRWAEAVNRGEQ